MNKDLLSIIKRLSNEGLLAVILIWCGGSYVKDLYQLKSATADTIAYTIGFSFVTLIMISATKWLCIKEYCPHCNKCINEKPVKRRKSNQLTDSTNNKVMDK